MSLSSKSDVLNYQSLFAIGMSALRLKRNLGIGLNESAEGKFFLSHFDEIDKFSLPTKPIGYDITEGKLNGNLSELRKRISSIRKEANSDDYEAALDLTEKIYRDIRSVYQCV
jgi:hypothetical protein